MCLFAREEWILLELWVFIFGSGMFVIAVSTDFHIINFRNLWNRLFIIKNEDTNLLIRCLRWASNWICSENFILKISRNSHSRNRNTSWAIVKRFRQVFGILIANSPVFDHRARNAFCGISSLDGSNPTGFIIRYLGRETCIHNAQYPPYFNCYRRTITSKNCFSSNWMYFIEEEIGIFFLRVEIFSPVIHRDSSLFQLEEEIKDGGIMDGNE